MSSFQAGPQAATGLLGFLLGSAMVVLVSTRPVLGLLRGVWLPVRRAMASWSLVMAWIRVNKEGHLGLRQDAPQ